VFAFIVMKPGSMLIKRTLWSCHPIRTVTETALVTSEQTIVMSARFDLCTLFDQATGAATPPRGYQFLNTSHSVSPVVSNGVLPRCLEENG
jgi:hypothetical protein